MATLVQIINNTLFGAPGKRDIKRYRARVEKINALEPEIQALSDEQLAQKTGEFLGVYEDTKARTLAELLEQVNIALVYDPHQREQVTEFLRRYPEEGRAALEVLPVTFDLRRLKGEDQEILKALEKKLLRAKVYALNDVLEEAFAVCRESARRHLGMRHFDVQLIGGMALFEGKISEMVTGEGKTLVATLASYLIGLTHEGVHVITVNDYLAKRDAEWMSPVFESLGLTCGFIQSSFPPGGDERREAYHDDITYGTNNEFGFDYLRDNMCVSAQHLVQRRLNYAIVDECDSILIDEARTPLIISGPVEKSANKFEPIKNYASQIFQRQKRLIDELIRNAQREMQKQDPNEDEYLKLFWQAHAGYPKHPAVMEAFEDVSLKRAVQKWELQFRESDRTPLKDDLYFSMDDNERTVTIRPKGWSFLISNDPSKFQMITEEEVVEAMEKIAADEELNEEQKLAEEQALIQERERREEHCDNLRTMLRAYVMFSVDDQYIVQDGNVVIIDEFTGRLMPGRRFSDGLHEALEAKEGVRVRNESQTLATITIQNYFRLYQRLGGMTGTAMTEAEEFQETYGLAVVEIPTNQPMQRVSSPDVIYRTSREKSVAVIEEIAELHEMGRPVLVGTCSVDKSEQLSKLLKQRGIKHEVLNAKQHAREAEIVAQAGRMGAVTIATNMAGRGTDILLGGNPEMLARQTVADWDELDESAHEQTLEKTRVTCAQEKSQVLEMGGLHIIGTERHESRRIDNQLRGRAGRQGDPGSSRFYLSLEDDLMRRFGGDRMLQLADKIGMQEGDYIDSKVLSHTIGNAQKKVESLNFEIRKQLLKFDNVMNTQREVIYELRRELLETSDPTKQVWEMVENVYGSIVDDALDAVKFTNEIDFSKIKQDLGKRFGLFVELPEPVDTKQGVANQTDDVVKPALRERYDSRRKMIGDEDWNNIQRAIMLRTIDMHWKEHMRQVDQLKEGIHLRGYGGKEPLLEYQKEAYDLFEQMYNELEQEIVMLVFRGEFISPQEKLRQAQLAKRGIKLNQPAAPPPTGTGESSPHQRASDKIGRNDPCPCGSGKKYKKCCGVVKA